MQTGLGLLEFFFHLKLELGDYDLRYLKYFPFLEEKNRSKIHTLLSNTVDLFLIVRRHHQCQHGLALNANINNSCPVVSFSGHLPPTLIYAFHSLFSNAGGSLIHKPNEYSQNVVRNSQNIARM